MNSKSKYHQAPIVQVIVSAGLEREQGEQEEVVRVRGRGSGRASGRRAGRGRVPGGAGGRGAGRGRRGKQPEA